MEENLLIKGYSSPPTPEDREDMMIISRALLWDLTLHYPEGHERRQWAEAKIAEVDAELGGRPGAAGRQRTAAEDRRHGLPVSAGGPFGR